MTHQSHLSSGGVKDDRPIRVESFQLYQRDFKAADPDQDGLYLDEFIGRIVKLIITPTLRSNKTALMLNVGSAAAEGAVHGVIGVGKGLKNTTKDSILGIPSLPPNPPS